MMTTLHTDIAATRDEARHCFELRYLANIADGKQSGFLDHLQRMVSDELDEIATVHGIKDGERIVGTVRSVWGGDAIPEH